MCFGNSILLQVSLMCTGCKSLVEIKPHPCQLQEPKPSPRSPRRNSSSLWQLRMNLKLEKISCDSQLSQTSLPAGVQQHVKSTCQTIHVEIGLNPQKVVEWLVRRWWISWPYSWIDTFNPVQNWSVESPRSQPPDLSPSTGNILLDLRVGGSYPVLAWVLASSQGEHNSSQYPHWIKSVPPHMVNKSIRSSLPMPRRRLEMSVAQALENPRTTHDLLRSSESCPEKKICAQCQ